MLNLKETTNQEMTYNKLTLAFPEKTEVLFLKKYFSDSVFQFRIAFAAVVVLYAAFGYLDMKMFPEYVSLFHTIRFLIVIPILITVFFLSFTKIFQKIWQVLISIGFIVGGFGIGVMTMLVPENYAYYAGMMLTFSAGYFFIKLRFFLATISGWTILIVFNIGAIFYAQAPNIVLMSTNFFFISANLIGMFAAYNIEFQARRNFFLNQKLDSEKLAVEELNINLEKTVEERTKELVKSREHAVESDRLKSAFLANMSHEIRTPMNGILGFADLLKEQDLNSEERHEYIRIIQRSGERMLNIINDIIDISKIEAGLMEVDIKESDINTQIDYIYTFFKPEAEKKGLKLYAKKGLLENEAIIATDREKLYAVLTNLVKNAIKFTSQGSIEIGYEKKGVNLEFYVKDTGIGIPNVRHLAIFERFIQADIADKMARQGAGLGLSISKAFLEMLGGELWLESEEGKGSTFYFTLPYNTERKEENSIEKNIETDRADKFMDPKNSGLKILIAEDDEISTSLITIFLEKFSTEITHTVTGVEAVEACRNNPDIDLILMDIQLPILNGYEATRQIRQFNKDVIIIAQTAYGLTGDKEKAIEAGCNDYISKPISKDDLFAIIKNQLDKNALLK